MKTWAWGAVATATPVVALMACSGGGAAGAGGSSATATVTATTSASTTGSGGADAGAAGTCASPGALSDCSSCATQATCLTCSGAVDSEGVTSFNNLAACITCEACYTTCSGVAAGSGCPGLLDGGPLDGGSSACDKGTSGQATCKTCTQCAETTLCATALAACKTSPPCLDLFTNLAKTCAQAM